MRNLKEYPITFDECREALDLSIEQVQSMELIGDTRPLCLTLIKKFMDSKYIEFEWFLIREGLNEGNK